MEVKTDQTDDVICAHLSQHIYHMSFEQACYSQETSDEWNKRKRNRVINNLQFLGAFSNSLDMQCALFHKGPRYFVVFRGSESLKDWLINSLFFSTKIPSLCLQKPLKVHSGFLKQLRNGNSLKQVVSKLNESVISSQFKRNLVSLTLTGHSLGGAQATIAAFLMYRYLHHDFHQRVSVVSFGAPRAVSVSEYRAFMTRTKVTVKNYIYMADPVPFLPPFIFQHPGDVWQYVADCYELVQSQGKKTPAASRKPLSLMWHIKPYDHSVSNYAESLSIP